MKTAGIVAEYNPFHTGHAYQIARTRGLLGADCAVVAVMSGNWVQRGACAAADKWTRAGWALAGGADLVLELPTVWAASSAESFATGAVALLRACGVVDVLSFGSESGDPAALAAAAACLDSEAYRAGLSRFLDEGMPFAACRQAVVAALLGSERAKVLSRPNDNLGVEYLRAASALGWSPQVLAVPRQGAGHDAPRPAEGFASASILREWIAAGRRDLADCFLPAPWPEELEPASLSHLERALLARVRSLSQAEWALLPDSGVEEGLPARLVQAGGRALSVEEFLTLAKTKRYSHARLRRLLLWAFLGLTAADRPAAPPYLRVLGFTPRGQELLRAMKGAASLPILTKPAHARSLDGPGRRLFHLEARCTDLYGLCFSTPRPGGLEWTTGPVLI